MQSGLERLAGGSPRSYKFLDGTEQATAAPFNNLTAISDPTTSDDTIRGYIVGSAWINTATGWSFTAMSVATGAANWVRVSQTSLMPAVVAQPGASNVLLPFTNIASAAIQLATGALNIGQFLPFVFTKPTPISALAFNITGVSSGGTAVVGRLGLFNDNGSGAPGTLIADFGTATTGTLGIRTAAGSRTVQPGSYWGAFKYEYSVVPTTHPILTCMSTVLPLPGPSMTSINYRSLQSPSPIVGGFTSNPTATPSATQLPVVGVVVA